METQFIYTYAETEQEIINYPISPIKILKDKKAFVDFAIQELASSEIEELVKISSCIIQSEKVKIPEWYLECNGKFYFKDGKLI